MPLLLVVRPNCPQVNRHGTREQRVVGIDRDKMYNMRQQHALGVTVASMIMGAGMGRRDDARALIRYEDTALSLKTTKRTCEIHYMHSKQARGTSSHYPKRNMHTHMLIHCFSYDAHVPIRAS